jgi:TRAP-type transport system periplasmic protein
MRRREFLKAAAIFPSLARGSAPLLTVRMALQPNRANKVWEAASLVREELERRSGGRIAIRFYDSAVLGNERQLLEACYLGLIHIVQCTSSVVSALAPEFNLLDMPYLLAGLAHQERVLNGPVGAELLRGLRRRRLEGLAFYSCGFRHLFNARGRQIRTPADFSGLKVRVMTSPIMVDSFNALGASATPLAAGEVFQALRTGVVDAAENNPQVFVADRYYEAGAMNFSFTRHFSNQHVAIANRDWLDGVGQNHPEFNALIREVARGVIPEYDRRWNAGVDRALETIRERGVAMNDIADPQPFMEKVQPVYENFFRRNPEVPRELLARIRAEARP